MKKIYLIILIVVLAAGCTIGVVVSGGGEHYDQSSPAATAQSFLLAMQNGDSSAFGTLTKDVIPWEYMVSSLISFGTEKMSDSTIKDYAYYQKGNLIIAYNASQTEPPKMEMQNSKDFFCMEFAKADGNYYIIDLILPGRFSGGFTANWYAVYTEAVENGFSRF